MIDVKYLSLVPLYVEPDHTKIEKECAWLQECKVEEVFREVTLLYF